MKTKKRPVLYEVPKFRVRCISGHTERAKLQVNCLNKFARLKTSKRISFGSKRWTDANTKLSSETGWISFVSISYFRWKDRLALQWLVLARERKWRIGSKQGKAIGFQENNLPRLAIDNRKGRNMLIKYLNYRTFWSKIWERTTLIFFSVCLRVFKNLNIDMGKENVSRWFFFSVSTSGTLGKRTDDLPITSSDAPALSYRAENRG